MSHLTQMDAPARGVSLGSCTHALLGSSREVPGEPSKKQPRLRALAASLLPQSWPEPKETSPAGGETEVHPSRSCQVSMELTILGLALRPAGEVPRGGAGLWPLAPSSGSAVIPSGLG